MNPYVSSNTNLPETTGERESAGGIVTFVTNLTASCSIKTGASIVSLITSTKEKKWIFEMFFYYLILFNIIQMPDLFLLVL